MKAERDVSSRREKPFLDIKKKKSYVKKRKRYIHARWVVLKGSKFFSVFSLIKVIKELGKTKDTKATMIKRGENKQDGEKKSPREDIKNT